MTDSVVGGVIGLLIGVLIAAIALPGIEVGFKDVALAVVPPSATLLGVWLTLRHQRLIALGELRFRWREARAAPLYEYYKQRVGVLLHGYRRALRGEKVEHDEFKVSEEEMSTMLAFSDRRVIDAISQLNKAIERCRAEICVQDRDSGRMADEVDSVIDALRNLDCALEEYTISLDK